MNNVVKISPSTSASRFYTANKEFWKNGEIIKKFGHLHYLVKLCNGHILKRHINLRVEEEKISRAPVSDEVLRII